MIFQSSMVLGKSSCDIPSGTIQGWDCPRGCDQGERWMWGGKSNFGNSFVLKKNVFNKLFKG